MGLVWGGGVLLAALINKFLTRDQIKVIIMCGGCLANVAIHNPKRTKLGPRTLECVFIVIIVKLIDFSYLFMSNTSGIDVDTIIESRDASFFESVFSYKSGSRRPTETSRDLEPIVSYILDFDDLEPPRSKRAKKEKNLRADFYISKCDNLERSLK